MKDLESAAREIIRLGNVATRRPWRFVQVLDGVEARALLDSPGYLFGRIDDLANGDYIAHTCTHAVDLARSWLEMRERLAAAEAVCEAVDKSYKMQSRGSHASSLLCVNCEWPIHGATRSNAELRIELDELFAEYEIQEQAHDNACKERDRLRAEIHRLRGRLSHYEQLDTWPE